MLSIRSGKFTLDFDRPRIVGILNVTPDSFSDGGKFLAPVDAIARAREMVAEGADMIDMGGESSRPGSQRITIREELGRILPVLDVLVKELSVPISIDTMKPVVADECLARGASIINDVSGLRDQAMREVAARLRAPVIIMHMQGTPDIMQTNPQYENVVEEIIAYLEQQAALAKSAGIEQIIIDPGIGFGKTVEHNLTILRHLGEFRCLGYPVMIGVSRKSFLQKITGAEAGDARDLLRNEFRSEVMIFRAKTTKREEVNTEYSLTSDELFAAEKSSLQQKDHYAVGLIEATLAAEAIAGYNGADIIRTHDVAAAHRALAIAGAIRGVS